MLKTDLKRLCMALLLTLFMFTPRIASAHLGGLLIVRSDPPVNAVLPRSPEALHLWFEDPVNPRFSQFQLRDINTRQIETPASQVAPDDPTQLSIILTEPLPDGLYIITYQAISAVDGHDSQGSYAFIVGEVSGGFEGYQDWNETSDPLEWLALAVNMSGLALLLGGLGLQIASGSAAKGWRPTLYRLTGLGLLLGLVSELILLSFRITPLITPSVTLVDYLLSTRQGILGLAVLLLGAGCGLALIVGHSVTLSFVLATGWVLTHSLSSRVLAIPDQYAAAAGYWLHAMTAYLLAGGLAHLLIARWRWPEAFGGMRKVAAPYSGVVVLAMGASGAYLAWMRTGSWDALLMTTYGQSLLLKGLFGLVCGVVIVLVMPASRAALHRLWRPALLTSAVGLVVVIGLTGILLSVAPARDTLALRQAIPWIPDDETILQELATVDDLHVQLFLTPGVAGSNRADLLVFDGGTGARLDDVTRLNVTFWPPESGEGVSITAEPLGDGLYSAEAVMLVDAGIWQAEALVSRAGQPDIALRFQPELAEAQTAGLPLIDTTIPVTERVLAAGLTAAALLLVGGVVRRQRRWWWLAVIVTLGFTVSGFGIGLLVAGVLCVGYGGLAAGQRARGAVIHPVVSVSLLLVAGVLLVSAGISSVLPVTPM